MKFVVKILSEVRKFFLNVFLLVDRNYFVQYKQQEEQSPGQGYPLQHKNPPGILYRESEYQKSRASLKANSAQSLHRPNPSALAQKNAKPAYLQFAKIVIIKTCREKGNKAFQSKSTNDQMHVMLLLRPQILFNYFNYLRRNVI